MRASDVPQQRLPLRSTDFRAMGCDCRIVVLGGDEDLLRSGEALVRRLDDGWSRFSDSSELTRLNRRVGRSVKVSQDMLLLVSRSVAGVWLSGGLFNPLLGREIVEIGYDRDFSELDAPATPQGEPSGREVAHVRPSQKLAARIARLISVNRKRSLVRLASGVQLDSGGIGKGLAADVVVSELRSRGAVGVMVSIGGDVCTGGAWPDDGWRIAVHSPIGIAPQRVKLRGGAVCTSGVTARCWRDDRGNTSHHLLDPRRGRPLSVGDEVAVSVIAPAGWRGEIATKVAMVGGRAAIATYASRAGNLGVMWWDRAGHPRWQETQPKSGVTP